MSKFDMIIGYTGIKKELQQVADTLKNCEAYEKLNVSPPRGLLLHGEPGVGKSLMASAIIEASERPVFVCRKDKPNGDFVKEIKAIFDKAVANEPSIVYLDDLDKFANSDEDHRDAEEYVTVQSCIDEAKEKGVFVLATANNMRCLPRSLYRAGRFDRVIKIRAPRGEDAIKIITHYLSNKKVVEGIDAETIARIMNGRSCAELENVINEAGICAGYERAESITMEHFMEACLRTVFNLPTFLEREVSDDNARILLSDFNNAISQIVYHEAGHAVVSEILCPKSVNFVSAYNENEESGGLTNYYNDGTYTSLYWEKSRIISSLGGRAALEQKYRICDMGGENDLDQAFERTRTLVLDNCINGFHLYRSGYDDSERLTSEQELVVSVEVEKFYHKAKEIISSNQEFFEKIAIELLQKRVLSFVDIQRIKSECRIVPATL